MRNVNRQPDTSRRAFFVRGGAALGAGLASASAGAALLDDTLPLKTQLDELQRKLAGLEDRDAIAGLFQAYTTLTERQAWDAVATLFSESADLDLDGSRHCGPRQGIPLLLAGLCNADRASMHTAFRSKGAEQETVIAVNADGQAAQARFRREVRIARPITEQNTLADMARLQGMDADSRWQQGDFALELIRGPEGWRIRQLHYRPVAA